MPDFTYITVTHNYGTEVGGVVIFSTTALMRNLTTGTTADDEIEAAVVNGLMTVTLAATDDPTTSPSGALYNVYERLNGTPSASYNVVVPRATTPIDLELLPRRTLPDPITYYDIQLTAGTGLITYEQVYPELFWDIGHNLGRHPFVQAFDENEYSMMCSVKTVSQSQLQLIFSRPSTGKAVLS